jgi:hypothetical protein
MQTTQSVFLSLSIDEGCSECIFVSVLTLPEREREGDSALVLQMQMIAQRNGCEVEEQVDYSTT